MSDETKKVLSLLYKYCKGDCSKCPFDNVIETKFCILLCYNLIDELIKEREINII